MTEQDTIVRDTEVTWRATNPFADSAGEAQRVAIERFTDRFPDVEIESINVENRSMVSGSQYEIEITATE